MWQWEYSRCTLSTWQIPDYLVPLVAHVLSLITFLLRVLAASACRKEGALLPLCHLPIITRETKDQLGDFRAVVRDRRSYSIVWPKEMKMLCKIPGILTGDFKEKIESVAEICETCIQTFYPLPPKKISLSNIDSSFNMKIQMELLFVKLMAKRLLCSTC